MTEELELFSQSLPITKIEGIMRDLELLANVNKITILVPQQFICTDKVFRLHF